MAAMTTVLTEFSNSGNSRTSTTTGHLATKPKLVIEKRRVPDNNQIMTEFSCKVVHACEDSDGVVLSNKVSFEMIVRYPLNGIAADLAAAKVVILDVIAGDEFDNSVSTQEWL